MSIQPEFVSHRSFKIIGVERYTDAGIAATQQAWDEFAKRGDSSKPQQLRLRFVIGSSSML